MYASSALVLFLTACTAAAKTIVITVGGNTTDDASSVFQPQRVTAKLGDTVIFNFTQGNHTATESTFDVPCVPAHETNITLNGFNSDFRNAGNGTAVTILSVPIIPENENITFWFYDANTCGQGGVGVINSNESSTETLAGFQRNAIRLNGTDAGDDNSTTVDNSTSTSPSSGAPSPSPSSDSSSADRALRLGMWSALPLVVAGLFL